MEGPRVPPVSCGKEGASPGCPWALCPSLDGVASYGVVSVEGCCAGDGVNGGMLCWGMESMEGCRPGQVPLEGRCPRADDVAGGGITGTVSLNGCCPRDGGRGWMLS